MPAVRDVLLAPGTASDPRTRASTECNRLRIPFFALACPAPSSPVGSGCGRGRPPPAADPPDAECREAFISVPTHLAVKHSKYSTAACGTSPFRPRPPPCHRCPSPKLGNWSLHSSSRKTKNHIISWDRHEAIDDDSEAYCWRRSGFFWRMRASFGLACAQATTLAAQVFGKGNPRSRAGRTSA